MTDSTDADVDAAATRLRTVRARADRTEEQLNRLVAEMAAARQRIDRLEEQVRETAFRADHNAWQLDSVRAGRWWRLGQALAAAKRRPIGLPRDVVRALRGLSRPNPPVRAAAAPVIDEPEPGGWLDVTPPAFPDGPVNLSDLTVAVVLDASTSLALRYEWRQIDGFGPDDWRPVLERERPGLLFAGSSCGWPAEALAPLVAWCREQGIPTVFWIADEDSDVAAARLFDRVYVTEAGSVSAVREALGHDRVDVLLWAAQPRLHNPIGVPDRGTFDVGGPPGAIVDAAQEFGPHVFAAPRAVKPAPGQTFVGELPYETMLAARKRYKVIAGGGPRDIFELVAAGTPVVSQRSDVVTEVFGGLVPVALNHREAAKQVQMLLDNAELRDRNAHLALRAVLDGHTYRHRVATVLAALGIQVPRPEPPVSIVLATRRADHIGPAITRVACQTWRPLQLVMVLHGLDVEPSGVERQAKEAGLDNVVVIAAARTLSLGACLNLGIEAADGAYIGKMDDDEMYGPYYIADLVQAFGYTEADIVGKLAHYVHLSATGANVLRYPELEHSYVDLVRGGALLARGDLLRRYRFDDVARGEDTRLFRRCRADGIWIYSADRFSFVMVRHADPARHTWQVSDQALLTDGRVAFYGPPEEHVLI